MFRKFILGSVLTAVAGTMLFGTAAWSYFRTAAGEVQAAVKNEVPLEFQIKRAEDLVADLVPEVRKSLHVVAQEQVEIERLERSIDSRAGQLAEKQAAIRTMRSDLETDRTHFVYAGVNYSRAEVASDLAHRFDRFQIADETLDRDRARLETKKRTLASHRQQLDAMLDARKELELEIDRLQARLQSVRAAETVTELAIDDSALSQARTLIEELNNELDVRERLVEEQGTLIGRDGEIPVEVDSVPVDLTDRIDAYFGNETKPSTQKLEMADAAAADDAA